MTEAVQAWQASLGDLLAQNPMVGSWYTSIVRIIFPLLALMILVGALRSLWRVRHPDEVWGYLTLEDGERLPITHWENLIGRAPSNDLQLAFPTVSRQHAALIRAADGSWRVYDLDSKGGVTVAGLPVEEYAYVAEGDKLSFGGVSATLQPISAERRRRLLAERKQAGKPRGMWGALVLLTLFQLLTAVQLTVAYGAEATPAIPLTFAIFSLVCWGYFIVMRAGRRIGFEMETIAFFLCTLSLAATGTAAPEDLPKQLVAILLGMGLYLALGFFLRDLQRAKKVGRYMAIAAVLLLAGTLMLGQERGGAKAWIFLGPISLQPSELAKVCYIFAGTATLDRLFNKRNLTFFILLTGLCGGCLALMNDFGTALVFFVTFLVIAFLRSGDFATLALICSGCGIGGLMLLRLKPHVASRFALWGHIWEDVYGRGFQQTHTLTAAASGGLCGVGAGRGWLAGLPAADTDIVFGLLCEEWGLLIAGLTVLCIVVLAVFAVRACRAARSSFYTIAACAATSLLVFQTCLNVFGAVDLLPFTGVTLPFVSNGGSSMLSAWGMLAFLKAADLRQNASFAVRLPSRRELQDRPETDTPEPID